MHSMPRGLACFVAFAASACGFNAGGVAEDSGTGDETATETAGTEDEVGTDGTDASEGASSDDETGGGANCGNGMIEQGEPCDGEDFNTQTCASLGFVGGTLACTENCTLDATGCTNQLCGNGIKEGDEECDSQDFGGVNCVDLGFGPGLPLCTPECTLDTSPCTTLGEGDPCQTLDPCINDLNCINNVCHDGSPGDPCENDGHCQSNTCVGESLFMPGVCA